MIINVLVLWRRDEFDKQYGLNCKLAMLPVDSPISALPDRTHCCTLAQHRWAHPVQQVFFMDVWQNIGDVWEGNDFAFNLISGMAQQRPPSG